MKVLFIINMEDLGFEEPLGILYLSAMCKQHGHETYAVENDIIKIEKKIESIHPDLLALSVLTPNFSYLFETVRTIKTRFDLPVILGGPHATFFPEAILEHQEIDYMIRGEAEEAFVEFLNRLQNNDAVDDMHNLVMRDRKGQMKQNPLNSLVSDLDLLPFPDRDLLAEYKVFYDADVRSVMASRGCPYDCSYCFNRQFKTIYKNLGKIVRVRSVDNIVQECFTLKEVYNAKMLHFFDDIFPYQREWLDEFVEKYTSKIGLPFFTNTRFTVCSEEYIKKLSQAGCKTLLIGVEAGNEALREHVLHRKMSNQLMIEKSRLIHQYGIKIYSQNIIGLPYGSLEKDLETLKLNIDLKADFAGAYLCQPYPGTEIEKMAKEAGILNESYEIGRSFYYSSPLNLPKKKEIEKLRLIFALIVNFPFLYRYTHFLLEMPNWPFKFFSSLLHGYKIKTVVLRYEMGFGIFMKNIKLFFLRRINSAFKPPNKKSGVY